MLTFKQFLAERFKRPAEAEIKKLFEYPSKPGQYVGHQIKKQPSGNISVSYKDLTGDKMMLIISPDKYTVFAVGPSNMRQDFRDWDKLSEFILYSAVKRA